MIRRALPGFMSGSRGVEREGRSCSAIAEAKRTYDKEKIIRIERK